MAFQEDWIWVVKTKTREMFRLYRLHTLRPNIAQAQRLTIILGHLFAQQQQPQRLLHQLSIAQAQKPITIRGPLCAQQQPQQPHIHLLSIVLAQKPIIIQCLLCAQQLWPPTLRLSTALAQNHTIIQCLSCAQQLWQPTHLHSTAQAPSRTIILIHSSALFLLLLHLVVSQMPLHLRQHIPMLSIAVLPDKLTTQGPIFALIRSIPPWTQQMLLLIMP